MLRRIPVDGGGFIEWDPEHEWRENSGTTDICAKCGCTRYHPTYPQAVLKWSVWRKSKDEWGEGGSYQPSCVPGRGFTSWAWPEWLKENLRP